MEDKVIIFDTTLRDGEQSPGASMNIAEKLRLAKQLEKLGVDVIEAGFPASSLGDMDAVSRIAEKIRKPKIAALARANKKDIEKAWEAVKNAAYPRIHVFIATSDIHMKYKLKKSKEQVVKIAVEAVKYAASLTEDVEFSAEDASRSDKDFLCHIFAETIKAGAKTINIPDTVGYAMPDEFFDLISYVKNNTPGVDKAVISIHCHNDLGLATANVIAGIKAGARQAEVTMNGIGERAGNTSLEEVAMTIYTRKEQLKVSTGLALNELYPTSRLVSMVSGIIVQPNKAIVGANAFLHEAGIHQDGILKNRMTYEIMEASTVGVERNFLILGKHSGRHAFRDRLFQLGYEVTDAELNELFSKFKDLADKKKEILDEDIEALVAEELLRPSDIYRLEYLNVVSGNCAIPTATIKLIIRGEAVQSAGFGAGPIDACYNTISKMTGITPTLLRFSVTSISGGTDAQGEVTVRLESGGIVALGKGTDPDIITASAKAYLNGLNRIEHIKNTPNLQINGQV